MSTETPLQRLTNIVIARTDRYDDLDQVSYKPCISERETAWSRIVIDMMREKSSDVNLGTFFHRWLASLRFPQLVDDYFLDVPLHEQCNALTERKYHICKRYFPEATIDLGFVTLNDYSSHPGIQFLIELGYRKGILIPSMEDLNDVNIENFMYGFSDDIREFEGTDIPQRLKAMLVENRLLCRHVFTKDGQIVINPLEMRSFDEVIKESVLKSIGVNPTDIKQPTDLLKVLAPYFRVHLYPAEYEKLFEMATIRAPRFDFHLLDIHY